MRARQYDFSYVSFLCVFCIFRRIFVFVDWWTVIFGSCRNYLIKVFEHLHRFWSYLLFKLRGEISQHENDFRFLFMFSFYKLFLSLAFFFCSSRKLVDRRIHSIFALFEWRLASFFSLFINIMWQTTPRRFQLLCFPNRKYSVIISKFVSRIKCGHFSIQIYANYHDEQNKTVISVENVRRK